MAGHHDRTRKDIMTVCHTLQIKLKDGGSLHLFSEDPGEQARYRELRDSWQHIAATDPDNTLMLASHDHVVPVRADQIDDVVVHGPEVSR